MFIAKESDWKEQAKRVLISDLLTAPAGTYVHVEGVNNGGSSTERTLWIAPIMKAVLKGTSLYLHFAQSQPFVQPLYEGENTIKLIHKRQIRAFEFYQAPEHKRVFRFETIDPTADKPLMRSMLERHAQQHWGYINPRTTVDDDPDHDFYVRLNEQGQKSVYQAYWVDVILYDEDDDADE